MTLYLPIGPPACGKSTLAAKMLSWGYLERDAVVSTDVYRRILTGDHMSQDCNTAVFEICNLITRCRLLNDLDVWYDATNLTESSRKVALDWALTYGQTIISVLFDVDEETCLNRNSTREHPVPNDVMQMMFEKFRQVDATELPGHLIYASDFIERNF